MYFFDNRVINLSKTLKPSKRKELEIVDLLNKYKKKVNSKRNLLEEVVRGWIQEI